MRLFFATTPSLAAVEALRCVAPSLGPCARLVPQQNYHVTLAFVGEVAHEALDSICQIGAACVGSFSVSLTSREYWPRAQVVVAAADHVEAGVAGIALRLQAAIAGYRAPGRDEPPWRPHVTLARKVLQAPVSHAMSAIAWTSSSFSLFTSERREGRSVYTVVDTWPLLDKN
jgi:2'-5' RNA ligase